MVDHLAEFIEDVEKAPYDPYYEHVVRRMIVNCANQCPMGALTKMAEALIEYRKSEQKAAAELN
jgi:hypothetical protein